MRAVHLCAIVKDEGPYIEEWLEYHILKGVSHFYIYDHGSTDDTLSHLIRYPADLVTVVPWGCVPVPAQRIAYLHRLHICQQTGLGDIWLGYIDIDEFFVTRDPVTIPELFSVFDQTFPDAGVYVGNWKVYGSSGHIEKPEGLVIENFTKHQKGLNQHVKGFVRPQYSLGNAKDVHSFYTDLRYVTAAMKYGKIAWPFQEVGGRHQFWINHYLTKSKEEYRARCAKGRVDIVGTKDFERQFEAFDNNESDKDFISSYVEPVKNAIKERRCSTK